MNPVLLAAKAIVDELGGVKAVAHALGKSQSTLAHELDPNYTGAKLGLETAVAIDRLHGQGRIAQAIAMAVGGVFMPLIANVALPEDADARRTIAEVMTETADVIRAAAANMEKNRGENGLDEVRKESLEAIGAIIKVLVMSERQAERREPSHLRMAA